MCCLNNITHFLMLKGGRTPEVLTPRSCPHLIDFGGKNNSYSIICKTVLLSGT